MKVLTADEFAALTPYQKGLVVYLVGARDDQPNVPEAYEPAPGDKDEYIRGQQAAILQVQDSEE